MRGNADGWEWRMEGKIREDGGKGDKDAGQRLTKTVGFPF